MLSTSGKKEIKKERKKERKKDRKKERKKERKRGHSEFQNKGDGAREEEEVDVNRAGDLEHEQGNKKEEEAQLLSHLRIRKMQMRQKIMCSLIKI